MAELKIAVWDTNIERAKGRRKLLNSELRKQDMKARVIRREQRVLGKLK